jgi:hypothetical protein
LFYTDTEGDKRIRSALKNKTLKLDLLLQPQSAIPGIQNRMTRDSSIEVSGIKKRRVSKSAQKLMNDLVQRTKEQGRGIGSTYKTKLENKKRKEEHLNKSKGGYDMWNGIAID